MVKNLVLTAVAFVAIMAAAIGAVFLLRTPVTPVETSERIIVVSRSDTSLYQNNTTSFFVIQDEETKKKFLVVIHGGRPAIAPLDER
jgi:hypothetical protein